MKKILVANRGEIAMRVMRSARELGIETVAIFSEADRNALHVRYADEAVCIGPPPSKESYLRGDKIIDVCKRLHVDGIHPGYGFLAENAEFAKQVSNAGLIFIGPSPEAMEKMGSKLAAKETMRNLNVPMIPGTDSAIKNIPEAKKIAGEIGFPIMIKASAGGGGKGMRVVHEEKEFEEQLLRAQSEARSSFGNDAVFIEKYISSPRHVEIPIIGDQYGNVVHLFERDCSIQRRHQKLVEEAPSCVLTNDLRKEMGESAVAAAKACGYGSAGTVEFLVDDKLNYYFLEMNTRLQVEHTVTEFVTGFDFVREQIRVARGEKLSFTQKDLHLRGNSIELRVCAEDPLNNFLPDTGVITNYKIPQGPGVRVDDGVEAGMEISVFYDSLLSKLIVYAENRDDAIAKMIRAIDEYEITGVKTTLAFGKWIMQHHLFKEGKFDTNFIEKNFKPEMLQTQNESDEEMIAASLSARIISEKTDQKKAKTSPAEFSAWKRNRN